MIRLVFSGGDRHGSAYVAHIGARVELDGVNLTLDFKRIARLQIGRWCDEHGSRWRRVAVEAVDAKAVAP